MIEPYHDIAPTATSIGRQFVTALARSDETSLYTLRQLALLLVLPSYGTAMDFQAVKRALRAPKTSVSLAIAKLVSDGLVERRDNPRDRRRAEVSLTPKGERWVQEHLIVRGLA